MLKTALMIGLSILSLISYLYGSDSQKWVVYYSDNAPLAAFKPYSLVILDSQYHPPLNWFIERGVKTCGYLSLGEIEKRDPYFEQVKRLGIFLGENPNWKDSYLVDLRSPQWAKLIIEELVPHILFKRFNGIFIDTLDHAAELEEKDPETYKGMRQAAIQIVKAIRFHYPEILIILNRAYPLLPEVGQQISMVMGESIYTKYNFDNQTYERVPEPQYKEQVQILQDAQKRFSHLQVLALDYWYPEETDKIRKIYQVERENGFSPYVSTVELNRILPEPQ